MWYLIVSIPDLCNLTYFGEILSIYSHDIERNKILMSIKGHTCHKGNNPNLDLVNINAYTRFSQKLSIFSKVIERKRNSDINQGPQLCFK